MRESVTYQALLEEGRKQGLGQRWEEGYEEGDRARGQHIALTLLRASIPIDLIVEASGLSIDQITQLKQANHL